MKVCFIKKEHVYPITNLPLLHVENWQLFLSICKLMIILSQLVWLHRLQLWTWSELEDLFADNKKDSLADFSKRKMVDARIQETYSTSDIV